MSHPNPSPTATASQHYDQGYFNWQTTVGEFGGWANLPKFERFVREEDTVLDFGCGGGYLLKQLKCRRRLGLEPAAAAAAAARALGIEVFGRADELPDDSVDVIISNNALEHTFHPLGELKALLPKLRAGGKIVFVVPCESIRWSYAPRDINYHLYSWSPMCAGNLFTEAGFRVIESKAYIHKWPPLHRQIARWGGRWAFELACRIYGRLARTWFQVRVVAEKPA